VRSSSVELPPQCRICVTSGGQLEPEDALPASANSPRSMTSPIITFCGTSNSSRNQAAAAKDVRFLDLRQTGWNFSTKTQSRRS
jgi:hypothetical protein